LSKTVKFLTLTFSEGLNVLVSFLFLPYLARSLSLVEYGTYGQTILAISILHGVFAFGLSKVIFAFLANEENDKSEIFFSNLLAAFFLGLFAILTIWLFTPFISLQFDNPTLKSLIPIYSLSLPFGLVATSLNSSLIFFDRVKESAFIAVLINLIKIGLVVAAIQLYSSLSLVFIALVLVEFLRAAISYIYIPKHIKQKIKINFSNCLLQIKIGWPLGVASMIGVLIYSVDGYMVSAMLDVKEYAIYRNGAFQIPFISSIYGAVTAILLPDVSKLFAKKDFKNILILKRKVITNTALLIFPLVIFCIFFAEPLITTYLSEKYTASFPIFMVYNLVLLARFTSYDDLFIASNNNNRLPKIYLITFVLNIILNYFLISYFGSIGAAIASVIAFYFLITYLFKVGASFVNINPVNFFQVRKLVLALSISIITSLTLLLISNWINLNYYSVVFFLGVNCVVVYHIFMKYGLIEYDLINNFISKFGTTNKAYLLFQKLYRVN